MRRGGLPPFSGPRQGGFQPTSSSQRSRMVGGLQATINTNPPISDQSIDHNYYQVSEQIANNGCFNDGVAVFKRRRDNKIVVRKGFRPKHNMSMDTFLWEMQTLRALQHPNVCAFIDGFVLSDRGALYMEYCDLGNLKDYIDGTRMLGEMVPPGFAWNILAGLTRAVLYCHYGVYYDVHGNIRYIEGSQNWTAVVHADIKPDNIFLKSPRGDEPSRYPVIKLGDFGVGRNGPDQPIYRMMFEGPDAFYGPSVVMDISRQDVFGIGWTVQAACDLSMRRAIRTRRGIPRFYPRELEEVVGYCMPAQPPVPQIGDVHGMLQAVEVTTDLERLLGSARPNPQAFKRI